MEPSEELVRAVYQSMKNSTQDGISPRSIKSVQRLSFKMPYFERNPNTNNLQKKVLLFGEEKGLSVVSRIERAVRLCNRQMIPKV
jgi:hypothetical protein